MIIVKYSPDGMKSVILEDATMSDFWSIFRRHKKRCEEERTDDAFMGAFRTSGNSFEVVDESLAASTQTYVARPDDWPCNNGEPQ